MSNMSYCRFQNTLEDLKDCQENWEKENRSPEELKAQKRMMVVISQLYNDYCVLEEYQEAVS